MHKRGQPCTSRLDRLLVVPMEQDSSWLYQAITFKKKYWMLLPTYDSLNVKYLMAD